MGRPSDLYDPRFVQGLFDEMSQTYGVVNLIASFGFAHRWRKQCVGLINVPVGGHALDLMAGMGELSAGLRGLVGAGGRVTGLDLSSAMCERAAGQAARWRGLDGGGA
ncbi:MAG: class I SAM-dependent methyltransferase, partial [Planctomycetota bacterium]